jgi:hypothetical protein
MFLQYYEKALMSLLSVRENISNNDLMVESFISDSGVLINTKDTLKTLLNSLTDLPEVIEFKKDQNSFNKIMEYVLLLHEQYPQYDFSLYARTNYSVGMRKDGFNKN